jgi:hypothetical protein
MSVERHDTAICKEARAISIQCCALRSLLAAMINQIVLEAMSAIFNYLLANYADRYKYKTRYRYVVL